MSAALEARIARVLDEYDAQGWHRTGTGVDATSARWFEGIVREAGATPVIEEFALQRLQPHVACIEAGHRRIDGLPLFDAPAPAAGSITGTIGPLGSGSAIGLVITRSPAPDAAYDALRRDSGHQALVGVTVGPSPGLQARNAGGFKQPFGVPVLQVGSENLAALETAAEAGSSATLTISSEYIATTSSNVAALVPGAERGLAPVVVSTPRTGWWNCSGERGGGIACWLELLDWAVRTPHRRDVLFAAFAGHELNHLGLDAFLEQRPTLPTRAHAWVHFGANIGARQGAAIQLSASREADLTSARALLDAARVGPVNSPEAGVVNGGESAVVARMGARCIALLGGNNLFHYEADRWPANNDVPQIARQAGAFVSQLQLLADSAD